MTRAGIDLATLLRVLDDPRSVEDLQRYFAVGRRPPNDLPPLTGGRFDRLAGGGDRLEVQNVITTDDLIAVEMLSVRVPPRVALDLLEGSLGRDIATELHEIPVNFDLGSGDPSQHVKDGGHAYRAWHLLKDQAGVGWVIAGKLLARKRPRLIPVYDSIVSCAYRTSTGFWRWLDRKLREDGGVLAHRLAELRNEAGLSEEISPLRVLDVVMWMRHRDAHTGYGCPGLGGSCP